MPRVASGFGGGIGETGLVCGAISGAAMSVGWRFGRDSVDQDSNRLYGITREIVRSFESEFGTTACRELVGCDLTDPEQRRAALESGIFSERCARFVEFCAREIVDMLSL